MADPRPWENQTLPCILRAWNNWHGYSKHLEPAPDHENTLAYFYTLVPEGFATTTIPSDYFHVAVQERWLERIGCTSIFIVNGAHIYLVKREADHRWRRYDWPHTDVYENIHALLQSTHHTLFVIALYPVVNLEKLKGCFVDWVPKRTEFYLAFKRRLMAVATKPPFTDPQT
jgi:hypothetical protein